MAVRQIEAERVFVEHRGLLHAVAYRVLGSVTEAEDVVQDAWLRWSRVDPAAVSDVEGFLVPGDHPAGGGPAAQRAGPAGILRRARLSATAMPR